MNEQAIAYPLHGMSMRDYFSAKSLQGLEANPNLNMSWSYDDYAKHAYRQADAMLKARGEQQ